MVMDSFGIGGARDAAAFGDEGSNTLSSVMAEDGFSAPTLASLGLFHIDGVLSSFRTGTPTGAYARVCEMSQGKDTTIGHWEIAGIRSDVPLPTYPDGFPERILRPFSEKCGRGVLCNKPYSGTEVIRDFGREHMQTGDLIVYTSADSVFQIAAHEDSPEYVDKSVLNVKDILEFADTVKIEDIKEILDRQITMNSAISVHRAVMIFRRCRRQKPCLNFLRTPVMRRNVWARSGTCSPVSA